MTTGIIITLCVLLLLAYFFDITAPRTKIPSVILLLLCGWLVRQFSDLFAFKIPDLTPLLPLLGSVGLILIVLEGSLELPLSRAKAKNAGKAFIIALLSIIILMFLIAYGIRLVTNMPFRICLVNAIPFSIISSSIAISSARGVSHNVREFVTYESSLSDIFGVIMFNFLSFNERIGIGAVGAFSLQLLAIMVISIAGIVGLAFLLNKISHHIKYAPIIILVILIYEVSKVYHLPSLLFILLFGLFLGNIDKLKQLPGIHFLQPDELRTEVQKFRELIIEATFLVRAVFFLLFGYLIESSELLNTESLSWALAIVLAIFMVRFVMLKVVRKPVSPLLYIAPRGLITVLLYLAIDPSMQISFMNRALVIQVVVLTALVMMLGMLFSNRESEIQF